MTILASASRVSLLALALSLPASAEEAYDSATRAAIQGVVTKQLDAFAHDDAVAAEGFAAPAIKQKFPKPDEFLEMVKKNYAALLHPKSTTFTDTASSPHGPLQKVTIVAADGTVWTAIYSFEQIDGMWRISGCGLAKDEREQDI